jgi:hypothetical protein
MKKANMISSLIILSISIVYVIEAKKMPMSDGLSPGAGFIPFWIGIFMVLLSASLFIKSIKIKNTLGKTIFLKKGQGLRDIAYITFSLFAYSALINLLGYQISTFIFLIFLFKAAGRYTYKFSFGLSIIVTFALYGIFEYWLEMALPAGRIAIF